jgi:glycosyltransferase involved in cell wall biosynthesis
MSGQVDVSIVMPVKNEARHVEQCLEAVFRQDTPLKYEVIVIDSGSTDGTLEILRKYPAVKLVQIKAEEFGHGRTRNLGAQSARGDIVVFLNADAIPLDENWLAPLLNALKADARAAGAYSRHIPRQDCDLYMRRDLLASMPPIGFAREGEQKLNYTLFSTVSAAVPRQIWQRFPFAADILIAEDQEWARRVLAQGFKIVYEPASRVLHSHNYPARELYRLKFKVGKSFNRFRSKGTALLGGFVLILGGFVVKFCGDILFIFRQQLPLRRKLKEIKMALLARLAGFWGRYRGWLDE